MRIRVAKSASSLFIDTSYIVALVNTEDQDHAIALSLAEIYDGCPLVVTDAVLLEIGNALSKNYKMEAVAIIRKFLDSQEVELVRGSPEIFDKAFALYSQLLDKTWGLVDCMTFVAMRGRGITQALTADNHFTQAGFQALMRP